VQKWTGLSEESNGGKELGLRNEMPYVGGDRPLGNREMGAGSPRQKAGVVENQRQITSEKREKRLLEPGKRKQLPSHLKLDGGRRGSFGRETRNYPCQDYHIKGGVDAR